MREVLMVIAAVIAYLGCLEMLRRLMTHTGSVRVTDNPERDERRDP